MPDDLPLIASQQLLYCVCFSATSPRTRCPPSRSGRRPFLSLFRKGRSESRIRTVATDVWDAAKLATRSPPWTLNPSTNINNVTLNVMEFIFCMLCRAISVDKYVNVYKYLTSILQVLKMKQCLQWHQWDGERSWICKCNVMRSPTSTWNLRTIIWIQLGGANCIYDQ